MNTILGFLRHILKADAFSPTAFVARAAIISACYGVSELIGLREYTTFLSGTSANLTMSWQTAATFGLIHLLLYVAFILLVPASLITAGLLFAWGSWNGPRRVTSKEGAPAVNVVGVKAQHHA
jgi:hypothetical protein